MAENEQELLLYPEAMHSYEPDVEVVRRAIDGDEDAFTELFNATYRRMFFVARKILSRDEDIYDALQTAYTKAYKYIKRVTTPETFTAWLTKIVENSAKDIWRDLHPNEELTDDIDEQPAPDISEDADRRVLIRRVLEEMDPRRAEVLALYYYDGLKLAEIAKVLNEPVSTVYSRLKAAKRELTDLLAQRGIDRSFYSGGFFSAIAVALRSVLGTDILSAAVAQKMVDEVLTGKPGRLDMAAAKLAERQRNKAILRIAGLLLLLVVVVALLTSAIFNGWFGGGESSAAVVGTTSEHGTTKSRITTTHSTLTTLPTSVETTTEAPDDNPAITTTALPTGDGGNTQTDGTASSTTSDDRTTVSGEVSSIVGTTSKTSAGTLGSTGTTGTTGTTQEKTTTTTTRVATTTTRPATDISSKLTYVVISGKATITDCDASVRGAVAIPEELGGVPVDCIAASAFTGCDEITSVTFPDNLTKIKANAFSYCYNLGEVVFGKNLKTIDREAFANCRLEEVVFPDSVTDIKRDAFFACPISSITFGTGLQNLDEFAFSVNGYIDYITVRSGNSVYHSAGNCLIKTAAKTVVLGAHKSVIPNDGSVTKIGNSAFASLSNLQLKIPSAITYIGENAFLQVDDLYIDDLKAWCNITFDSNPMTCAKNIYLNGSKLTGKLVIPKGVSVINDYAFSDCDMAIVEIPEGVTKIGTDAFRDCTKLLMVSLPKSVKTVGVNAFYNCNNLDTVEYAGSSADRKGISCSIGNDCLQDATWSYGA